MVTIVILEVEVGDTTPFTLRDGRTPATQAADLIVEDMIQASEERHDVRIIAIVDPNFDLERDGLGDSRR